MIKDQEHSNLSALPRTAYDVVALAASLGGLKAIGQILSALPSNFPAAITVVQHLAPDYSAERVNFVRPSADVLFQSVAASFKERAIAVVLTGGGRDGAKGVQGIRKMGGTVLTQSEATYECIGTPGCAIDSGCVELILPLNQIAFALETFVTTVEADTSYGSDSPWAA